MIIAVSAGNASADAAVDPRFGRCAYFAVCDTAKGDWRFLENEGVKAGGGAGLAAAQQIIDNGIQAVITGNMGPNAFDVLHGDDITVYRCMQGTVQDAVNLCNDHKLEQVSEAGPAHAGTRGGLA